MDMITAERYHDISCGHRVVGHENKCKFLHGHNYRFHFQITANELDHIGRVLDFGVIKSHLCEWLEENFDHRFLIWDKDPLLPHLENISRESLFVVPFNPTAENIAKYMVEEIAPKRLQGTGAKLIKCRIEETRKCSATYEIESS
jgi:6-pyruvoyltetrahydropterin/6-carboxytetrahydropterin synthase